MQEIRVRLTPTYTQSTTQAVPADVTAPLWDDAAERGLLDGRVTRGTVADHLSSASEKAMKQLLNELGKQGLSFYEAGATPPKRIPAAAITERVLDAEAFNPLDLAVKGKAIDQAVRVDDMRDLQALDVFYRTGQTASLAHPALGAALMNMEAHGVRFFRNPSMQGQAYTKVGTYGAYHQVTKRETSQLLYAGSKSTSTPLHREEEILALSFFECEGSAEGLRDPQTATALRDLAAQGFTYHDGDDRHATMRPYQAWSGLSKETVFLGSGNIPLRPLTRDVVADPQKLADETRTLAGLYAQTLAPRVERREITASDVGRLSGAACPERGGLPLDQRWGAVVRLFDAALAHTHETASASADAARALEAIDQGRASSESLPQALDAFAALQQGLDVPRALDAFAFVRERGLSASEQADFTALAFLLRDAEASRAAWPSVAGNAAERLPLLSDLLTHESADPLRDGRSAASRAASGLALVCQHPSAAGDLREATDVLMGLHQTLDRREGWQASQDTFRFLADGLRDGSLGRRSLRETADAFVALYVLRGNLEQARAETAMGGRDPGKVEQKPDEVVIGGIKIPRRPGFDVDGRPMWVYDPQQLRLLEEALRPSGR